MSLLPAIGNYESIYIILATRGDRESRSGTEGTIHQYLCPLLPALEPNPQWDGVRWWALWEVIGDRTPSEVGSGAQGAPSPVRRVGTHRKPSPRAQPAAPDLDLPPPDCERSCLLSIRHVARGRLLQQPKQTRTLGPSGVLGGLGVRGASSDTASRSYNAETIGPWMPAATRCRAGHLVATQDAAGAPGVAVAAAL